MPGAHLTTMARPPLFEKNAFLTVTISTDSKLPVGTYFYIIKYNNNGNNLDKAGYLYINR